MKIRNTYLRRTLFIMCLPIIMPALIVLLMQDFFKFASPEFTRFMKAMWYGQDNDFED